jgi:hypothetical protein
MQASPNTGLIRTEQDEKMQASPNTGLIRTEQDEESASQSEYGSYSDRTRREKR